MELQGVSEKRGYTLHKQAQKIPKSPQRVLVENGRILCPACNGYLGDALMGAHSGNINLRCPRCKSSVRLNISV